MAGQQIGTVRQRRLPKGGLTAEERVRLRAMAPTVMGVARTLRLGESTVRELLDPHGVATLSTLERVRAMLAQGNERVV